MDSSYLKNILNNYKLFKKTLSYKTKMGHCTSCEQSTIKTPQIDIQVPSTEDTLSHNNVQIPSCRNKVNGKLLMENGKHPGKIRSFMKVPTIRQFEGNRDNIKIISAEKILAKTKTLNPHYGLDMSQSVEPSQLANSKLYYSPKKGPKRGKTVYETSYKVNQISSSKSVNKDYNTVQSEPDVFQVENIEVTNEQENKVFTMLRQHYLFRHFDEKMIKIILENSQGYQIEPGSVIFNEGDVGESFFIIQNGKVEITSKSSNEQKILGPGDGFGELALIYNEVKRNSTAISITKLDFYVIFGVSYRETSKNFSKHSIEQITYFMNGNCWLSNLDPVVKLNLASLALLEDYDKNEYIYSNKTSSKTIKKIFLVKGGTIEIISDQSVKRIYPKDYFGEHQVILDIDDQFQYDVVAAEASSAYVITQEMMIEAIGTDYKDIILFSIFTGGIMKNSFFKNILMECYYKSVFDLFNIKIYQSNEVVYNQVDSENKKAVLILKGALCDGIDKTILASQGMIYGDEIINSKENLENNIIAAEDLVITLECPWVKIRNKLKELSKNSSLDVFKRANKLSKMYIFKHISESKILEICQLMKKVKYNKNDVIIKENTQVNSFYVISKGRIRITKNNHFIREVEEGNCFGEMSLLNDENSNECITAMTEVQCYSLSREVFLNFLIDENMNDYIKKKMCLEDTNVELEDLYHLAFLGRGRFGTVSLVHNTISLYAIKTVPKSYIENNFQLAKYILNEKNVLLSLDFPLIVKLVKTLKTENLCFFLMEYISGKSLEEYINSKTIHKNINEAKFFGGCMALILDYFKKKNIAHRDIKPANLIIDSTGYIKILDFGTAKKIRDFTFTIIGTPTCMAPEVLLGKGYSYCVDYWSFGICMYYIYYGRYPFGHGTTDIMEIYDQIINKELSFSREPGLFEFNHFLGSMLNKKPTSRLCTLDKIQNDPLYKGFNWKELMEFKMKPPYVPKAKELKDSSSSLNNTRKAFLPLILKYKFDVIPPPEEEEGRGFSTHRDYSNWFDEF